ncbi:hypothetical protein EEQ99_02305 [Rhizobium anhuiense]|uniref:Uncharacterized protein n=1 Tax=Rhizobium anhuiense TaxID=1184720 RepID=A0A3S0SEW5_9HYPH|nr:hypothetical protein EEQ99_02305 [Rhizobium anhuiense]
MFHLDIDAQTIELDLDVFIPFYSDGLRREGCSRQQTLNRIEVLKKIAAMYGFNSKQLRRVQNTNS